VCLGASEPEEKLIRLYRYVRDQIAFDGDRRIIYKDKLSDLLETRRGNSAAINLLLREMLAGVGIEAHPLLISTRNHGRVFKDYPMINQFNHLLCYAQIGEEEYFLDATHPFRPYDLLAYNDLNGQGWLLDKANPRWKKIPDHYVDRKLVQGFLTITPSGGLEGEINIEADGYLAQSYRTYLARNSEEDFLQEYFYSEWGDDAITDVKITGATQAEEPLKIVLTIAADQYLDMGDDKAYFNPLLTFGETENPFLEPKRKYPIDFVHQRSVVINLIYTIPDNWEIEDRPKNTNFKLPNNEVSLAYFLNSREGAFDLSNRFRLQEVSYDPSYYPALKKLYDAMIARHGELVVFRLPSEQQP
ncbi:MAG: transglutaminase-like domain-containing protein, partial [Bacteroidota bacterium]